VILKFNSFINDRPEDTSTLIWILDSHKKIAVLPNTKEEESLNDVEDNEEFAKIFYRDKDDSLTRRFRLTMKKTIIGVGILF
jgi:hypothetical protein